MNATTTTWTLDSLLAVPQKELVQLFLTLDAPAPGEVRGEYGGHSPLVGLSEEEQAWVMAQMYDESSSRGYWLGKAFSPSTDGTGQGYNIWRRPGDVVTRSLRFGTHPGPSHLDGRPALVMTYATFSNEAADLGLVDEIRKVTDGLYLGCGIAANLREGLLSEPSCFVLDGPIGSWVGVDDAAAERHGPIDA